MSNAEITSALPFGANDPAAKTEASVWEERRKELDEHVQEAQETAR